MRPFKLTEGTIQPGCHRIGVEGEVDMAVADRLRDAIEQAATENDHVLIDLQRCEFIDSTVIAIVLQAHKEMAAKGQRIAVYGASSQVRRVLSITGLVQNGLVFETSEEALAVPR